MFLAIDVGNTTIALGCFAGGKLRRSWKISTHPIRTFDELRAELHTLLGLDGISLGDVTGVAIASVVPRAVAALREAFSYCPVSVIDSEWKFSFRNATREPAKVGIDRLVNLEAACVEFGAPAIVVDSGTATTISVLEPGGIFTGGAILPGLALLNDALGARAAQLFAVDLVEPEHAIGRDTREALQSGLVLGYGEMVRGLVERMRGEMGDAGREARVIVTGGNAAILQLPGAVHELHLTLRGIEGLHARTVLS